MDSHCSHRLLVKYCTYLIEVNSSLCCSCADYALRVKCIQDNVETRAKIVNVLKKSLEEKIYAEYIEGLESTTRDQIQKFAEDSRKLKIQLRPTTTILNI